MRWSWWTKLQWNRFVATSNRLLVGRFLHARYFVSCHIYPHVSLSFSSSPLSASINPSVFHSVTCFKRIFLRILPTTMQSLLVGLPSADYATIISLPPPRRLRCYSGLCVCVCLCVSRSGSRLLDWIQEFLEDFWWNFWRGRTWPKPWQRYALYWLQCNWSFANWFSFLVILFVKLLFGSVRRRLSWITVCFLSVR